MKKFKEFTIPFSGLKIGKHQFDYHIKNTFFEAFEYGDFNDANVNVEVHLEKKNTLLEFQFKAKGTVNVNCDLSNESYNQSIEGTLDLVVKFGEFFNDDYDEILILPHGEHQLNIAQYIYELIVLSIPSKRIHPGIADGTLTSETLKKFNELQNKKPESNVDPRWETLQKLVTNK